MTPNGARFDGMHTYSVFNLIPKSKMLFAPPQPKYVIQPLAGVSGELDYTEFLTNKIAYKNRVGSFEFLVINGSDYQATKKTMEDFFDGRKRECVLDDDPDMTYTGRFYVNDWKSWEAYSTIVIDYDVEPYRYSSDNISLQDWLWDDMVFSDTDTRLFYGSFGVHGTKYRNLYNPTGEYITPILTCSVPMTVMFDGVTYQLPEGSTETPGFTLAPGNNTMAFYCNGDGSVGLDYPLEVKL